MSDNIFKINSTVIEAPINNALIIYLGETEKLVDKIHGFKRVILRLEEKDYEYSPQEIVDFLNSFVGRNE